MECPHIPIVGYGDFSKRLHDKVENHRIPISGSMEVTARCNLRCAHCYINLPANDHKAQSNELTYDEICAILDDIVDEGCLWLLLTGGEPFIRPDFLDIYTYAKKKGLLITLFSNGTTITPGVADHLAKWRPFAIEVTLYGATKETYERVTGVPESFERCMRGIELLRERNLSLKLKSMILNLNKHEVWDMQAYAEHLGPEFRFDPILNVRMDGGQEPGKFRLTPAEVVELDQMDDRRVKEWREFSKRFWGPPQEPESLYHCGAGLHTFHIDPHGMLSVCMMSRKPSYDLRQGNLGEGWHSFLQEVRTQRSTRETPCASCDLFSLCGQCPGWAEMEGGDSEEPVEYLCQVAHLRVEALGLGRS